MQRSTVAWTTRSTRASHHRRGAKVSAIDQRQDGMGEDMNRERREPAGDALLAARDPGGLQHEVGDVMLEREDEKEDAESPEGNGGTCLRHMNIQSMKPPS